MDLVKLKRKNNFLIMVLLVLILMILVVVVCFVRAYFSGAFLCKCENDCELKKVIDTSSLDNSSYIGVYNHEDNSDKNCIITTTLVLNSDYSSIFYIGDCNNKSYYYGKYKIEDKKIVLYSVVLHDTTMEEEMNVLDEAIYFNIVDSEVITSIYGRDKSIRLEKFYNVI